MDLTYVFCIINDINIISLNVSNFKELLSIVGCGCVNVYLLPQ